MYDIPTIEASIADIWATGETMQELVKEEKRAFTEEEQAEWNRLFGEDNKGGELAKKDAELEAAKNFMARKKARVSAAVSNGNIELDAEKKITVPAKARRHGHLKAFTNEEDAYSCGRWLQAVVGKHEPSKQWCRENGIEIQLLDKNWQPMAVMTEGTNTAGGFLVPAPLENSIIRLVEEYGVFRAKAMPWTMTADTDSFPKRTGGLTRYYPAEAATITASDASVGRESLLAVKMATMTRISSELNEDSVISVVDWLAQEIATTFATGDDEDGFIGDGTSTYGGRTGLRDALLAGSEYTAATGNTAFSTLDDADFLGMMGQLPRYSGINPEWYISPEGYYASMARLITASGGVGKADMEADFRPVFHGRPVNFVNVMNATLTAQTSIDGLCYYGDLRMAATLGVRRGVTIATDASRYFDTDEIAVRATQRTGQNIHDIGTSTAAGAIIGLTTPAS